MLKTILITVLIVAISMALFSVKILFKKNGRFPNTHVSGNKATENAKENRTRKIITN